jgi:hypothetical protein
LYVLVHPERYPSNDWDSVLEKHAGEPSVEAQLTSQPAGFDINYGLQVALAIHQAARSVLIIDPFDVESLVAQATNDGLLRGEQPRELDVSELCEQISGQRDSRSIQVTVGVPLEAFDELIEADAFKIEQAAQTIGAPNRGGHALIGGWPRLRRAHRPPASRRRLAGHRLPEHHPAARPDPRHLPPGRPGRRRGPPPSTALPPTTRTSRRHNQSAGGLVAALVLDRANPGAQPGPLWHSPFRARAGPCRLTSERDQSNTKEQVSMSNNTNTNTNTTTSRPSAATSRSRARHARSSSRGSDQPALDARDLLGRSAEFFGLHPFASDRASRAMRGAFAYRVL